MDFQQISSEINLVGMIAAWGGEASRDDQTDKSFSLQADHSRFSSGGEDRTLILHGLLSS